MNAQILIRSATLALMIITIQSFSPKLSPITMIWRGCAASPEMTFLPNQSSALGFKSALTTAMTSFGSFAFRECVSAYLTDSNLPVFISPSMGKVANRRAEPSLLCAWAFPPFFVAMFAVSKFSFTPWFERNLNAFVPCWSFVKTIPRAELSSSVVQEIYPTCETGGFIKARTHPCIQPDYFNKARYYKQAVTNLRAVSSHQQGEMFPLEAIQKNLTELLPA